MAQKTRLMTVVAAATVTLTVAACSGGGTTDGSHPASGGSGTSGGNATGTLVLGSLITPTTLEASETPWANASIYLQPVYDTLLHETPDAQVVPWLATSWSYNAERTVLTMKLRTGIKFSDSEAFDASVAAQNIKRFRDGTSPDAAHLSTVQNVEATAPDTLKITLSQPNPALLTYLAQDAGLQASPKSWTAPDAKTHPVGTGPYILDSAQAAPHAAPPASCRRGRNRRSCHRYRCGPAVTPNSTDATSTRRVANREVAAP
jgi:peptide/nickel transport system substrate-binding protein